MEKYFKFLDMIKAEKIDITKLYLLDCLKYQFDNKETIIDAMNFCCDLWLDADVDLSLARLADIVADNWQDIQNDKLQDTDIIEMCLDFI